MGSLRSIAEAVATIQATEPRLDVVVDNAGAIFPTRTVGPDGIEAMFATLVVGPFALVSGLLPMLRQSEGAQVIAVTSGGMYGQRLDLDDLQSRGEPYSGTRAYARAKRAQVALVREWARRLGPAGITFNAMHPGWADTPGLAAEIRCRDSIGCWANPSGPRQRELTRSSGWLRHPKPRHSAAASSWTAVPGLSTVSP